MRVNAQPSTPPDPIGAAATDRTGAPTGEPFRAALRAAGTGDAPGTGIVVPSPGTATAGIANLIGDADDTMAPAAAQVALLARDLTSTVPALRTRPAKLSDATQLIQAATPGDAIANPVATLPLAIAAPGATVPGAAADPTASSTHATATLGRRAASPTGAPALPGVPLDATAIVAAQASIAAPAAAVVQTGKPTPPPAVATGKPALAAIDGTASISPAAATPGADATDSTATSPSGAGLPTLTAARLGAAKLRAMGPAFAAPATVPATTATTTVDADDHLTTPPQFPEADIDPGAAAMLRAAYGMPSVGAPATLASAGEAATTAPGSPMDAWLAAAVSRALGALGGAEPAAAPTAAPVAAGAEVRTAGRAVAATVDTTADLTALTTAPTAPTAAAVATANHLADLATTALTPLEQAVRDLVTQFGGGSHGKLARLADDEPIGSIDPTLSPLGFTAQSPFAAAAHDAPVGHAPGHAGPAATAQLPEPPSNPSHVHLVLDDGPERVVATVAVRGSEVHVALRSSDDATAAALARNAASLDHAMRGRGLELHDLTSERETRDHRPSQDAEPRERRQRNAPRFELEEKP